MVLQKIYVYKTRGFDIKSLEHRAEDFSQYDIETVDLPSEAKLLNNEPLITDSSQDDREFDFVKDMAGLTRKLAKRIIKTKGSLDGVILNRPPYRQEIETDLSDFFHINESLSDEEKDVLKEGVLSYFKKWLPAQYQE